MNTPVRVGAVMIVAWALLLSGCGKSGKSKLVGKWVAERPVLIQTIEFTKDGRMNMSGMAGHFSTWYKIEGKQMVTGRLNGPTDDKGSWRFEGDRLVIGHALAYGRYKRVK